MSAASRPSNVSRIAIDQTVQYMCSIYINDLTKKVFICNEALWFRGQRPSRCHINTGIETVFS